MVFNDVSSGDSDGIKDPEMDKKILLPNLNDEKNCKNIETKSEWAIRECVYVSHK